MVIMQNRWSSASVIVLPGQCRYTSPTSNSSKYRPNGRSWTVMGREPSCVLPERFTSDEVESDTKCRKAPLTDRPDWGRGHGHVRVAGGGEPGRSPPSEPVARDV